MKKVISLFLAIIIVSISALNVITFAEDIDNNADDLHPLLRLSDEDYASFSVEDGVEYDIHNLTTGESLTYNSNTNSQELKNIYVSGLEDVEYGNNQTQIITSSDSEYQTLSSQFAEYSGSVTRGLAQPSKKQDKPYSGICLLRMVYSINGNTQSGYGTGFIIGETYIATAAHNYYDPYGYLNYLETIEVYTAIQGALGEVVYRKDNVHTVEAVSNHTVESDYALMTVFQPMELQGYYKLNNGSSDYENEHVFTIGFSGSEIANQELRLNLNGSPFYPAYLNVDPDLQHGSIDDVRTKTITVSSEIVGAQGRSGSPFFIVDGGSVEVVAILSRNVGNTLTGTRITSEIYDFYDSRVHFENINPNDYINNVSINQPNYFSGGEIEITILEAPTQYSWVGIYPQSVTTGQYQDNATGMYCYLQTGNMTEPNTFNNKYNVTVTLSAHTRDVYNMILFPFFEGNYKAVLFHDSGYTDLASQSFTVDGSDLDMLNYADGQVSFKYFGTVSDTAWVGIYYADAIYGPYNYSIAWTYVDISMYTYSTAYINVDLEPGEYKAILFADEGYVNIDEFYFTVE